MGPHRASTSPPSGAKSGWHTHRGAQSAGVDSARRDPECLRRPRASRRHRLPDHGYRTTVAGPQLRPQVAGTEPATSPLRAPASLLEPEEQGSTNTDGAQSAECGLGPAGSGVSPATESLPDGSGRRTTATATTLAGPQSRPRLPGTEPATSPLRAPASHLEPEEQGSTNTDGAQSAGCGLGPGPDPECLPRLNRLPDHGCRTTVATTVAGPQRPRLPGARSRQPSCLQHAFSYMFGPCK